LTRRKKKDTISGMGNSQRRKGARFERDTANHYRTLLGRDEVRRGLQDREKPSECDVEGFNLLFVETKNQRVVNPRAALEQARDQAAGLGDGRIPVVVFQEAPRAGRVRKGDRTYVIMYRGGFDELLLKLQEAGVEP